eukprot:gene26444-17543_t
MSRFAALLTGAGKTFSMSGDARHYQHRGIIPRAVHDVFHNIDMMVDKLFTVHIVTTAGRNHDLAIPQALRNMMAIFCGGSQTWYLCAWPTKARVHSEEDALNFFFSGEQNRSTSGHVLNASSSRSHCIFTIHTELRYKRTKKTHVTGQAMKEAQFINKSLSFLEQTVNALSKREAYVPFRQTKLTTLLRDALGGNCKTVMIANVWGEPRHMEETLSTLRFATRVRTLVNEVASIESNDPALLLKKYERQITELKQELALRDTLSGRGRVVYDDLTDAEIRELNQLAKKYLEGSEEMEQLPTESLKKIRETYKQMRNVFQSVTFELKEQMNNQGVAAAAKAGTSSGTTHDEGAAGAVGDADNTGGFGVGLAPPAARPAHQMSAAEMASSPSGPAPGTAVASSGGASSAPDMNTTAGAIPGVMYQGADRNAAFVRFKKEAEEGKALNATVLKYTLELKNLKTHIKDLTTSVNASKRSIDDLTAKVDMKKAGAKLGDGEVLDSEQYSIVQELKGHKTKYRNDFDKLKEQRGQLEPVTQSLADAKQLLINAFNTFMGSPQGTFFLGQGAGDDELDASEAFEKMQVDRINAVDPESGAYHAAIRNTLKAKARK